MLHSDLACRICLFPPFRCWRVCFFLLVFSDILHHQVIKWISTNKYIISLRRDSKQTSRQALSKLIGLHHQQYSQGRSMIIFISPPDFYIKVVRGKLSISEPQHKPGDSPPAQHPQWAGEAQPRLALLQPLVSSAGGEAVRSSSLKSLFKVPSFKNPVTILNISL